MVELAIQSYKFTDIVKLWARERLVHEVIVSKALVIGVIKQGLRFESVDPNWLDSNTSMCGYPYVGYTALANTLPITLRANTLEHMLSVINKDIDPSMMQLEETVVTKKDFMHWLVRTGQSLPVFWFERSIS